MSTFPHIFPPRCAFTKGTPEGRPAFKRRSQATMAKSPSSKMDAFELFYRPYLYAEICLTVISLFANWSTTDLERKLWEIGDARGWNHVPSNNYAGSHDLTRNLVFMSIFSIWVWAIRRLTEPYGFFPRPAAIIYDILLLFLWTRSLRAQLSGDFSDPSHPSPGPWFLGADCNGLSPFEADACRSAKALVLLTLLVTMVYGIRLFGTAVRVLLDSWNVLKGWVNQVPSNRVSDRVVMDEERGHGHLQYGVHEGDNSWQPYHETGWESEEDSGNHETTRSAMLEVNFQRHPEALSPVLAFFPEGSK